ncbi:MAG: cytochrome o ubiquinol oxidase subunit III [Minisyncoccia bacterium]
MNAETLPLSHNESPIFGFWVYLMSDCLLFAALFATYAVLHGNTFGGPGTEIYGLPYVFAETMCLLFSSFFAGLGLLSAYRRKKGTTIAWFSLALVLGLVFLGLEAHEFATLIMEGDGPSRSGFLSSYFVLVGTHGLHVTAGALWMLLNLAHTAREGVTEKNIRRLTLVSYFWHFLDLIWIGIFTIVYLFGIM